MFTAFKVLFGQLRIVINALLPWLKSEAAKFAAAYIAQAVPIVREIAGRNDLQNADKAKLAADMLKLELKQMGKEYKTRFVNQTIELAYEKFCQDEGDSD